MLRLVVYLLVFMPPIALAVWGAALIKDVRMDEGKPLGGSALLMAGTAFLSFTYGYAKIFWNKYRFTWEISCSLMVSFMALMGYQLLVVLYDSKINPKSDSFFGYSCIFLNCNCVLVVAIIFLYTGKRNASIRDFLFSKLGHGDVPDKTRSENFEDEIQRQRNDANFVPTFEEVADLFTILNVSEPKVISAFGGGVQQRFQKLGVPVQRLITILIYGLSVGVLVVYSYIIYYNLDYSKQGFVIMIAVLISDFILYLIFLCKIISYPLYLTVTAIINRFFLIIFGGTYWVYGYMIIFIYYGFILAMVIGNKRFPFEGAFRKVELDKIYRKQKEIDVARIPEFLLVVITAIFAVIVGLLVLFEPRGVPLPDLKIGETNYHFYIVAIFTVFFIGGFFSIYTTYRLFIRKKREIRSQITYFFKFKRFDMYWMFIILTFFFVAVFSLLAYWATKEISYFIFGIFTSISIILFLNAVLHYAMNDYHYLQNIKELNRKINKHNQRIQQINKKKLQFKKDLKAGNANVAYLGLAQSLLDKKTRDNQIKKQAKEIDKFSKSIQPGSNQGLLNSQNVSSIMASNSPQKNMQQIFDSRSNQPTPTPNQKPAQQTKKKSEEEENDDLIKEELKQEVDGICEGGEEEIQDISNQEELDRIKRMAEEEEEEAEEEQKDEDDDSDDEMVDPEVILENQEDAGHMINKQMLPINDWRDQGYNALTAYFKGRLRKNDYQIVNSLIFGFTSLIVMAVLICIAKESWVGVTICVPILHYSMAAFSFVRVLNTTDNMSIPEIIIFFLAYGVQYGWGIAYLFILYDPKDLQKPEFGGGRSVGGSYVVVYLLVIPFITSSLFATLKWFDEKKFSVMLLVQLVLTVLQGIAILICSFLYLTVAAGIALCCVVAFICYLSLLAYIYYKNNYYMPKVWRIINNIVAAILCVVPVICGIVLPDFLAYNGFSISVWAFCFFTMIYAVTGIYSDIINNDKKPMFFSPWIFPVYRFNPKKNDVEPRNGPAAALMIALLTMIAWSASCTVWVKPFYVGVSLSIIFQLCLLTSFLFLISVTQIEIKENINSIDNKIIRYAWLDSKAGHVSGRGASNRDHLLTYEKAKKRRDDLRNYIRMFEGRSSRSLDGIINNVQLKSVDEIDKDYLQSLNIDLKDYTQLNSKLFEVEKQLGEAYLAELELIIMFLLLMLQQAENLRESERKLLFNFLNVKKPALFALGIVINIPEEGTMAVRYARVVKQIAGLPADKQTMFREFREQFMEEKRIKEEELRKQEQEENKMQDKRNEDMTSKEDDERLQRIAQVEYSMDVDAMPDCSIKYEKIKKTFSSENKYTDKSFPPDDTSLGDHVRNFAVAKWKRASDDPLCKLYFGTASCQDIQQGRLGDCYFLSALSVLGSDFIMDKVILTKTDDEWRNCGAFHVMFYRNNTPYEIIVDDWFPVTGAGDWVFVRGGSKNQEHPDNKNVSLYGKEIWPMVIEKAYAKLYKSFSNIENGKVQYALADLTNGYPEQVNLIVEGKNTQILWERLKMYSSHGDLLGAGSSNPSKMGDSAITELGIVEGHAYAILRVEEVDNYRLIQLRNPHGELSQCEWSGDWCDDSNKWSAKMKKVLNYEKFVSKDADAIPFDGIFWMEISDFVQQFAYLYICRTLSEADGWKKHVLPDEEWLPPYNEGVPDPRINPNAIIEKNPQYSIIIRKPCDAFIVVKQRDIDPKQSFKGKQAMFFTVCKTDGKLIKMPTKKNTVCRSGPLTQLVTQTCQFEFDRSQSYPYNFTMLVANNKAVDEGRGRFSVTVCIKSDADFELVRMNPVI